MEKGVIGSIVAVLVAASLLVAGCGGGDDEATSSLTHAQFIKQGNALCKKSEEEKGKAIQAIAAELDPSKPLTTPRKEQLVLTIILPPYEQMIEDLKKLGPPEEDEEEFEALTEEMEAAARKTKEDPSVAVTSIKDFAKANKMAKDFGLSTCVI